MDHSLSGSCVHGILQARILEWVAVPSSRHLPDPGIEPGSPALQADALLSELLAAAENLDLHQNLHVDVYSKFIHMPKLGSNQDVLQ